MRRHDHTSAHVTDSGRALPVKLGLYAVQYIERAQVERCRELETQAEALECLQRAPVDLARAWMYSGEKLRVLTAGKVWRGVVIHAGKHVVGLAASRNRQVVIAFDSATLFRASRRRRRGWGRPGVSVHPATLIARVRELANMEEMATFGVLPGGRVYGRPLVAADTHVEIMTRRSRVVVPTAKLAWVAARLSSPEREIETLSAWSNEPLGFPS